MIGEVLRIIRITNDLSIREASKEMNISPTYISAIENKKRKATMNVISGYSEFYDIPKYKILEIDEQQEEKNLTFQETMFLVLKYYFREEESKEIESSTRIRKK